MYETFFKFTARPFEAAALTNRYFPAQNIENARQTLLRLIERAGGPGLLIGPAGTGKTLLCHLLAEQFRPTYRVVMLASARLCTRKALLQSILFELNLPYKDLAEGELRLSLIDHLEPSAEFPNGMLLMVDEAHALPLRLLEEIRMITNLIRNGKPRVQLILAGGPKLEERFANPRLESFQQRIAARCYLHAFSHDETLAYVRQQIRSVGGAPEAVFQDDALRAIHTATDGVPRLINQICDQALMLASLGGQARIDAAGIEEAWADLQQLPTPWANEPALATETSGIVEFGELADDLTFPASLASAHAETARPVYVGPEAQTINPSAQLDDIALQVGQIENADSVTPNLIISQSTTWETAAELPEAFAPTTGAALTHAPQAAGPEVELIFHGPHSPFDEPFDEEEVVLDRYASLEAGVISGQPRVSGPESLALAALLQGNAQRTRELDVVMPEETAWEPPAIAENKARATLSMPLPPRVETPGEAPRVAAFSSQSERLAAQLDGNRPWADLADELAEEQADFDDQESEPFLRVSHPDDRDLIVIDDGESETGRTMTVNRPPPAGKAKRQEYRQLFASLRRR